MYKSGWKELGPRERMNLGWKELKPRSRTGRDRGRDALHVGKNHWDAQHRGIGFGSSGTRRGGATGKSDEEGATHSLLNGRSQGASISSILQ